MSHEKEANRPEQTRRHENKEIKKHIEKLESARDSEVAKSGYGKDSELREVQASAKQEAVSGAEYPRHHSEGRQQASKPVTSLDKDHAFNTVMHSVRQDLSGPEKTLSKLVHQPVVEKTSEVLGKTILRPSGIIGATSLALFGVFIAYMFARQAGFSLYGSELPVLLVVGFISGLLIEWLYKSIRTISNKRSR